MAPVPSDERLEGAILDLLGARDPHQTACPSEVARAVHGADDDGWREFMEPVRAVARRLVAAGRIEMTQRGQVVDPADARGPIRLRLTRPDPGRPG